VVNKLPVLLSVLMCTAGIARAEKFDDGQSAIYQSALKGKKVVFVPLSLSLDVAQGWYAGMANQAKENGYELIVRDPNWDPNVGGQIMSGLVKEKPDLIVVQNPDMQAYARVLKQAVQAGIPVLQVNMKSTTTTAAYVGADWYNAGVQLAEATVKACGVSAGRNGKIAITQGVITAPGNYIALKGVADVFAKNSDISVVSSQAADWDAAKARSITSTVLKQHPDLCGIIGFWDGMDVGSAAAVREAGLQGKVFVATVGAGATSACDNVSNGSFSYYLSYEVDQQARDLNSAIKVMLQTNARANQTSFALYTPLKSFTKATLTNRSCWSLDQIKASGG
jgi:ribose transport system substrate-binding protein